MHEPDEEAVVQQAQVVLAALRGDGGLEDTVHLAYDELRAGRLAGVSACEADDLLEQLGVAFSSALAQPKVVLDYPPDERLVELFGDERPFDVGLGMRHRIDPAFRELVESRLELGDPAPPPSPPV